MLRFNPIFSPQLFGSPFASPFQSGGGYIPVDLNRFLGTGDIFQSTGGLFGSSPQDYFQMMQAQILGAPLVQFDPETMLQLILGAMLSNRMNGGGAGRNCGQMGGGGFSNRRAIGSGWSDGRSPGGGAYSGGIDGPRSQGQSGIPNGLRPNAANGARVVRQMGFTGEIGGLGHRSGPSDHPHGNAIDVMTHSDTRMGRQVAEHFRQNHEQLGVKYVIYQQQIASPRSGWQWRPMENRGSPTANHMDHPHISFY